VVYVWCMCGVYEVRCVRCGGVCVCMCV